MLLTAEDQALLKVSMCEFKVELGRITAAAFSGTGR